MTLSTPGITVLIALKITSTMHIGLVASNKKERRPPSVESSELPRPIIVNAEEAGTAPFGTIRVVLGVQGRLFGMPVRPKTGGPDEDILEEDG